MTHNRFDLLIIGAGPAGMSAAVEARSAGLTVCVADEAVGVGGQIYRSITKTKPDLAAVLGPDYLKGRKLAQEFQGSGADCLFRATVFMIERNANGYFSVGVTTPEETLLLESRYVLVATGALERPFPIKGWTLPGVMTAGAAQTMLKTSGTVPVGPICLAGCGPLLYLLAAQYLRAGIQIEAILDTTPWGNWLSALPALPGFVSTRYMWRGLKLLREVAAGTVVKRGVTDLEAIGSNALEGVRYKLRGQQKQIEVDTLLLHQGVVPQVNLALSLGVRHDWSDERLTFEPVLDEWGRTSVKGLFVAGDSAGIGGAEVASWRGVLAATGIVTEHDPSKAEFCLARQTRARKEIGKAMRGRAFLDRLYRPAPNFRMPPDDVIVCRCEEVSAADVRAIAARGATGPNQMKAFCRAGMGPCQGRMCGLTISELIAEQSGLSPQDVGYMTIRTPVKPIRLAEIARIQERVDTD